MTSSSYYTTYADKSVSQHNRPGDVRADYNTLLVFNGSSWNPINGGTHIAMAPATQRALDWAMKKMEEENQLNQLMEEYPALLQAKLHFDAMLALVKDPSNKEKA